jgi:alkylhydroperoxidase family enzyme
MNLAKIPLGNRAESARPSKRSEVAGRGGVLIETRGKVSDAQFAAVKDAGWTDANIVEMIALTAQFLVTNLLNNAVHTPIDFPSLAMAS